MRLSRGGRDRSGWSATEGQLASHERHTGLGVIPRGAAASSHHDQLPLIFRGRDHRPARLEISVPLGPHPDLARNVDPRLDREADTGHEERRVARLEIVEMWTGAAQGTRDARAAGV